MGMAVGGTTSTKSDPNVVPLIDILLVLLVIFMVITPSTQKGIDLKLPETASGTDVSNTRVIILSLKGDMSVMLNQEKVPYEVLQSKLRDVYQTRQDKTIFIRANSTLPYREVVKIIDIAKSAGVEVIGIVPEKYDE
jgi:biopolymer transport protein ExbD